MSQPVDSQETMEGDNTKLQCGLQIIITVAITNWYSVVMRISFLEAMKTSSTLPIT